MLLFTGETSGWGSMLVVVVGDGVLSDGEARKPEPVGLRMPIPDAVELSVWFGQSIGRYMEDRGALKTLTLARRICARIIGRVAILLGRVEHARQVDWEFLRYRPLLIHTQRAERMLRRRRSPERRERGEEEAWVPTEASTIRVAKPWRWESCGCCVL